MALLILDKVATCMDLFDFVRVGAYVDRQEVMLTLGVFFIVLIILLFLCGIVHQNHMLCISL